MKLLSLLLASLPTACDGGAPRIEAPVATAPAVPELEREAERRLAAWRELEAAHRKALEARRARGDAGEAPPHPAVEQWKGFEELARAGSGRAALWLATHVGPAHPGRSAAENRADALRWHEGLLDHADAPWIREWTRSLSAAYVELDAAALDLLVERFAAKSTQREAVAEALYRSAAESRRSKVEGAAIRAKAIQDRLAKEFADTEFGRRAGGDPSVPVGLTVGKRAPDFTTTDADGKEFRLSDYRGKVVVLDFWGFW